MQLPTVSLPNGVSTLPRRRDYLSYSAIALYQSCPLRFHFKYVAVLTEDQVGISLVFGTAFHAAVQHHFEHVLSDDRPPTLDAMLGAFWSAWRAGATKPSALLLDQDVIDIERLAIRMFRAFQASDLASPKGAIIGIEEELRGSIVLGIPDLLARIDLLIDEGDRFLLVDFKTAKCRWAPAKVAESAPQLLLYSELAKSLAKGKPLHLAFAVITKARHPKFTLHPVPLDPAEIDRTKRVVEQVWRAIERGEFLARPSLRHCPQCPYRKHCYAWADRER